MDSIEIRTLTELAEIRAAEEIQRTTWGMNELEIIPAHLMHALQHNGALLMGAFDGADIVGFVFGVLGTVKLEDRIDQVAAARLKMYSVVTGVAPEYQNRGVGYRLKQAQREFALRIGVRLVTWTYDPLESSNARFNIGKLGTICRRYLRNFHGEMTGLNAGLATDRFEVEWWVTGNRAQSRSQQRRGPLSYEALVGGGAVLINEASFDDRELPVPPPDYVSRPSNLLLVEIPADFQRVKEQDLALAQRWRQHTRHLFEEQFQNNFVVTDFVYHEEAMGRKRSFYLLTHQNTRVGSL